MIKYIRFNNFYSYLDDTEVSFEVGKQATSSAYDFTLETAQDTYRLNKVMAVLGANGSGKTQLLKAFAFLSWFLNQSVISSHNEEINISPFILNEAENSYFELVFFAKNEQDILDEYRYEISLNKKQIIKENLYVKTSRQFSYIFKRYLTADKISYQHNGFLRPTIALDAPKNISLLGYSQASKEPHPIALVILDKLKQTIFNISSGGRIDINRNVLRTTKLLSDNFNLKTIAEQLLCKFDTGIKRLEIKPVILISDDNQPKETLMPFGIHQMADGTEFELHFFQESNGTQSAYNLLGLILPILNGGGIAVIDELDNDLHPLLLPEILNLFRSSHTNPHNAQLIFTCHTPEVFNLLNKHQIYLVEKTDQLSEAWRLDEMEGVRNDDNLYAKYMAGAFSAVPNV